MSDAATPLNEQQAILREALAILKRRPRPDDTSTDEARLQHGILGWLTTVLHDHDHPEMGCLADPGDDCSAVKHARLIIAGEA